MKALRALEREEADHLMACLGLYEERLEALDKKMAEEAEDDEGIKRLQTVPGVGPKKPRGMPWRNSARLGTAATR